MASITVKNDKFSKNLPKPILNSINEVFEDILTSINDALSNDFTPEENWDFNIHQSSNYRNMIDMTFTHTDDSGETPVVETFTASINVSSGDVVFSYGTLTLGESTAYSQFLEQLIQCLSDEELANSIQESINTIDALNESYNLKVQISPVDCGTYEVDSVPAYLYKNEADEKLYSPNSQITLTASAVDHYQFSYWAVGGKAVSNNHEHIFEITQNTTYVANFAKEQYRIQVSSNNTSGYDYLSSGGTFTYNDQVKLVIIPDENYSFDGWQIDGTTVETNTTYKFAATENVEIIAYLNQRQVETPKIE